MARVVLPVVGAAAGYFLSGGNPAGAQWGWMAGSIIAGAVGTQTRRSVRINETGAQTTTEGAPRAIVFGAATVTGNLIDTGPIRIVETTEEAKGGGGPSVTTRSYFRTYAIRVCEGPIAAYLVAKRDGRVVYDVRPGANFQTENEAFYAYTNIYLGDETQLPSAALEAIHGAGEVPAHRGSAYIVFVDDDLTARQGSVPQWEFVVASDADADEIALTSVNAVSVAGTFGGGFPAVDFSVSATFDTVGAGGITGTAFLAYWNFDATSGGPFALTLYVTVDSVMVWSEDIVVTAGVQHHTRVQLNHARDATPIVFGWLGSFSGNFGVSLQGLQGVDPYHPIRPATAGTPLIDRKSVV